MHKNPGPTNKRTPKYPCKECEKNVRSNQDALLCAECNVWSHAKCLNLSTAGFKYYMDYPDIDWTCSLCSMPFRLEDCLLEESTSINCLLEESTSSNNGENLDQYTNENDDEPYANLDLQDSRGTSSVEQPTEDSAKLLKNQPEVMEIRKKDSRDLLLFHLNINSIQNKFEELKSIITEDLKAHVAFITETKIDACYPNSQFKIDGFKHLPQ